MSFTTIPNLDYFFSLLIIPLFPHQQLQFQSRNKKKVFFISTMRKYHLQLWRFPIVVFIHRWLRLQIKRNFVTVDGGQGWTWVQIFDFFFKSWLFQHNLVSVVLSVYPKIKSTTKSFQTLIKWIIFSHNSAQTASKAPTFIQNKSPLKNRERWKSN